MITLSFDIGSNSVGSAWIDTSAKIMEAGISIFPAGVDEADDKRGEPKNTKRRMTRHTRVTLARRADRKKQLKLHLIKVGLLPASAADFNTLLKNTDPWELRRQGLYRALTPHEFGRVLLHLAQRRGALGLKLEEDEEATSSENEGNEKHSAVKKNIPKTEDGKVKDAISKMRTEMMKRNAQTFGECLAMVRVERVHLIEAPAGQSSNAQAKPRIYRDPIRNKEGSYEHCADRVMIRQEFVKLWELQKQFGGPTAPMLTDELRSELDQETKTHVWRHQGLLFGQRQTYWDTGTLGRCALDPTERCVPHADMWASRYLVVETANNLKIIERGKEARALTYDERKKILDYLSGPLGDVQKGRFKGQPKHSVSVSDLRSLMGWGRASKTAQFQFNIEADEDRVINTDWFYREIVHGAVTVEKWQTMSGQLREGLNRAILQFNPDDEKDAVKLKTGVMKWAGLELNEKQADALIAAWRRRPKLDAKRLKMGRRATRNMLAVMDRPAPWDDPKRPGQKRWLTQNNARELIAEDADFCDVSTGKPLDAITRRRYATGTKGATARDRYYMQKHVLIKNGQPIIGSDGRPLAEPPPAPMVSNPVVRKALHEVRRHLVEFMIAHGRKPDRVYIELAREARMGKMDADRLLLRNRLRNRIRDDIVKSFSNLQSQSSTQQRTAVDRVILAVQQDGVCPLCGEGGLTPMVAAQGTGCELAHIIPRGIGGQNGFSNLVLSHDKCNRDMGRQTPRQFWETSRKGGFDEGIARVEKIYGEVERIKLSEAKSATANALWSCYFNRYEDHAKIAQFKKNLQDIQGMTERQEAATKYAAKQVMAYLADALYDGKGLPERSPGNPSNDQQRRIFATDGLWTSRLRREWGLFFDRHGTKAKNINDQEEHERKEKNRGDHRHHAIDAVVIALCTRQVQINWEQRERQAEADGIRTANEDAMENYRRLHPLSVPEPFASRDELRQAVHKAVFGDGELERPVCHRPIKRKLIGAFHEETLFGPVLDQKGQLTDSFTAKKSVMELSPKHLRLPSPESSKQAIARLSQKRQTTHKLDPKAAEKWAGEFIKSADYHPALIDPPPEKSGLVRDLALRKQLRDCLEKQGLNPDDFTTAQIKKLCPPNDPVNWRVRMKSGVPIKSVVLLRTMSDPVITSRRMTDYETGQSRKMYDATTKQGDARAARAYLGGNNHHIEIRVNKNKKGLEIWSGKIITAFEAVQRKLLKLQAFRQAQIPKPNEFTKLPKSERAKLTPIIRAIEQAHPLVDRTSNEVLGERFVMSLCEGEMLIMKHKHTKQVGYFVVAKLNKPQTIELVPHWDARSATERKNAQNQVVPDSKREQFAITPSDLRDLAAPNHLHAIKVRVSVRGQIVPLPQD